MFFTEEKANARINELSSYRYRDKIALQKWAFSEDTKGEIGMYPPEHEESNIIQLGDRGKGRDLYAWLSTNVQIPAEWSEKAIVGCFDFGETGGGTNSGFESLLFLNKAPYQGVDSNHKEVFLPSEHAGKEISFDFRLWSGLEGGGVPTEQEHQFKVAELAWMDETVD